MPQAVLALLLALQFSRPYHMETVASLATSRHTHCEVSGKVTLVRHEADGDWHIRVSDGTRFIVGEIIPTLMRVETPFASAPYVAQQDQNSYALPIAPPKVGDCVRVRGIRRQDNEAGHGWPELHPIESLEVIPCHP